MSARANSACVHPPPLLCTWEVFAAAYSLALPLLLIFPQYLLQVALNSLAVLVFLVSCRRLASSSWRTTSCSRLISMSTSTSSRLPWYGVLHLVNRSHAGTHALCCMAAHTSVSNARACAHLSCSIMVWNPTFLYSIVIVGMFSPYGIEQWLAQEGLALPQAWYAGDVSPPRRSRRRDTLTTSLAFYLESLAKL